MKPMVLVSGYLTGKRVDSILREIEKYRNCDLVKNGIGLVIASEGGYAKRVLELVEMLQAMNIPIFAKIYQAESAAALLALLATRREILKTGVLRIHLGSVTMESSDIGKNGQVSKRVLSEILRLRNKTLELMDLAGLPATSQLMDKLLAQNSLILSPNQCLELGLVDRIV